MSNKKVRLSKTITPQRYALTIRPDMEAFTFVGEEIIDLSLTKATKTITLHSKDLEITDGWFSFNKQRIELTKTSYNTKNETAIINFSKSIPKGKGKLSLHFRGIINEKLRGFYKSQYLHAGQTKHIATTQFEATDARRAFPCFDEPAHKAIFDLTLVIPNHLTAISNTIEIPTPKGVEHDEGYKVIKFASTPKMSTYLLAYIIGEFESVQDKTKSGVTIRVFTTTGKKEQSKFALKVAKRTLEFLNSYFDIPYPLPSLDLIAIPDFAAGAMENWGAITFRESAILVDEQHTAFANKQHVAEVIAHELVHQWFGNLVTMEWWTHLWLNESFASFMAYIVLDELFPEWNIWTRFVMHDHSNALELDSLHNTHPIEVEVHHPNQISEIFDAISYDKGASVLRMLQNYLGAEDFRNGLRYYLKKHSYKNTESIHLWEAFEKVSKKPISTFMKQWVSKPGYPLVTIAEPTPGKVKITQNRFTLGQNSEKTLWPIPLQLELKKDKLSDLKVVNKKQTEFTVSFDSSYLKTNPNETGFYRTLYSPSLLAKLYEPIKRQELSVVDRYGIIRDLFAMVKSGRLPTSTFLEFLTAFENEESYIVWIEILSGMQEIYNLVSTEKNIQSKLAKQYLQILKTITKTVGWEVKSNESQSRTLLRSSILYASGQYGDTKTLKTAKALLNSKSKKPLNPNLRSTIYSLNSIQGDLKLMNNFRKQFKAETFQEEQRRLGKALMSFNNEKLFKNNLDFVLTKDVRSQDTPLLIAIALSHSKNGNVAWKWLQKNWPEIQKRYQDDHLVVWIIKSLAHFTTESDAKEIAQFYKKHPLPVADRAIKQVLEKIKLNATWLKRDKTDITHCVNRIGSL